MRTQYNNGDPIDLGSCNGCAPATINGVFCHELGCPDAWRDYTKECGECGCDFMPEDRYQTVCNDCVHASEMPDDDCDDYQDGDLDDDEHHGQNLSCFL